MMTEAVAAVVGVAETSNYRQVSDNAGIRMNAAGSHRRAEWTSRQKIARDPATRGLLYSILRDSVVNQPTKVSRGNINIRLDCSRV
jgi:hypothetical protein